MSMVTREATELMSDRIIGVAHTALLETTFLTRATSIRIRARSAQIATYTIKRHLITKERTATVELVTVVHRCSRKATALPIRSA